MSCADPRHSFGQFRQGTSGLFETGNGGIKLLETATDARRMHEIRPVLFLRAAGQVPARSSIQRAKSPCGHATSCTGLWHLAASPLPSIIGALPDDWERLALIVWAGCRLEIECWHRSGCLNRAIRLASFPTLNVGGLESRFPFE